MAKSNTVNFYLILYRRKWSVERWIQESNFQSKDEVLSWAKAHENEYEFCDKFYAGLENYFLNKEEPTVEVAPVVAEVTAVEAPEVVQEDTQEAAQEVVEAPGIETTTTETDDSTTSTRKTRKKVQSEE